MMRPKINANQVAESITRKPPVLGWNDKDALQDMEQGYAVVLDNIIPYTDYVEMRGGHTIHSTGIGTGAVETLLVYNGAAANKMLAAGGAKIYNITTGGAVGAALGAGYASNKWQYVNFNGYLSAVNGYDTPIQYDGSTIADSTMTGMTTANLIHVNIYSERLFFVEKNSLSVWYLPVKSITGALTQFDLSYVARKGGYLVASVTYTRDSGDGVNDLIAFLTSQGEVIVYQGTDPSTAATWALVGIFQTPAPLGYRCFENFGADVVAITKGGFLPLSASLPSRGRDPDLAISSNIRNNVNRAVELFGSLDGWEVVYAAEKNLFIFNIPTQTAGISYQFVMNTDNGSWCRFTGLDVKTMCIFNGDWYYGNSSGKVCKGLTGKSDNGVAIQADAETAWDYVSRNKATKKIFSQIRPSLSTEGQPDFTVSINYDFKKTAFIGDPNNGASGTAAWGSPWGVAWGVGEITTDDWYGVDGGGYAFSTKLRFKSNILRIKWLSTDYLFERGNIA